MVDQLTKSFAEYSEYILRELERLADEQESVRKDVAIMQIEVAVLKTKAALLGGGVGALVSALISILAKMV